MQGSTDWPGVRQPSFGRVTQRMVFGAPWWHYRNQVEESRVERRPETLVPVPGDEK